MSQQDGETKKPIFMRNITYLYKKLIKRVCRGIISGKKMTKNHTYVEKIRVKNNENTRIL